MIITRAAKAAMRLIVENANQCRAWPLQHRAAPVIQTVRISEAAIAKHLSFAAAGRLA
jgi:hypothetical protein